MRILVIMAQWIGEHRAFMIEAYFKANDSYTRARRRFCNHFGIRRIADAPSANLVKSWVQRFRETSSAINKKPPGKERTVRTPDNVARVRRAVNENPRRSVRKHAQMLNMSSSSVYRILTKDMKFHPFKIQMTQYIKETDYAKRKTFAETMINNFWNAGGLEEVLFSDEANFHLDGYVNKHNARYWSANNPRQKHSKQLHSKKVTVWCAMSASGIIGPYFFEDARGRTVTVNAQRYRAMLNNFLRPALRRLPGYNANTVWFQQDGATAHTAELTLQALTQLFPGTLISMGGDILYPPRSPDLSPLDFFLWGYLKSVVYADPPPANTQALKDRIEVSINNIPAAMCQRVYDSLRSRLEECYQRDGQHLDGIIFKK